MYQTVVEFYRQDGAIFGAIHGKRVVWCGPVGPAGLAVWRRANLERPKTMLWLSPFSLWEPSGSGNPAVSLVFLPSESVTVESTVLLIDLLPAITSKGPGQDLQRQREVESVTNQRLQT